MSGAFADGMSDNLEKPYRWFWAGLAATIAMAIFMEGVARLILGGPLKPAVLICQVLGWDLKYLWAAEGVYYFSLLIVLPLLFLIFRKAFRWAGDIVAGVIWGALLWYGSAAHAAPSVGIAPFFGAGNVMYTSLAGHIIYGAVLGAVFYYYTRRVNSADR